ncbi:MAG TPA: hypothetical protein PKV98_04160 [Burkholderiaceae bacterium]|nr:hypothetical protein [Burkholderiaceae bacterium]
MTPAILIISSLLSAWAFQLGIECERARAPYARVACITIHYVFGAIAIGAGIQLLFRG